MTGTLVMAEVSCSHLPAMCPSSDICHPAKVPLRIKTWPHLKAITHLKERSHFYPKPSFCPTKQQSCSITLFPEVQVYCSVMEIFRKCVKHFAFLVFANGSRLAAK